MLRKIAAVLFAALLCILGCVTALPARAVEINVSLYDESGLLSDSEYNECYQRLKEAAEHTHMHIGVVLATTLRSDQAIEAFAVTSFDALFGQGTDGLLYYMDLKGSSPYDYIVTSGMGQFYYTNAASNHRINAMYDAIDPYLYPAGSEDVDGAVIKFAEQVEYYYDAGIPERYYYYDDVYNAYFYLDENGNVQTSSRKPYRNWGIIFLVTCGGLGVGLLTALIVFFAVRSRYQFKYSLEPTTYINRRNVVYHQQYDNFIRTYTNRVRIDSGGGSGGRGGGGGGGFSSGGHGGGGHHR